MALPNRGRERDLAVDNGVWYGREGGSWVRAGQRTQEYLGRYFQAVTGTGPDQQFIGVGEFGEAFSLTDMRTGARTNTAPVASTVPSTMDSGTEDGKILEKAFQDFTNDANADYPPMFGTEIDPEVMGEFLDYVKQRKLLTPKELEKATSNGTT